MIRPLKNILNQLNLIEHNAVFFRRKEDGQVYNAFTSEIKKKIEIIKPDAFFIFNKQPFVLFFDLTNNSDSKREKEIHKQVWSFDHSPVIFIIKDTEVQVFNAFSYNKKNESLEKIELTENERNDKFSFWKLQSGSTWKWLQQDYYENSRKRNSQKRVNQRLFENIKEVRESLTHLENQNRLSDDAANTLILRLIFVRYLIDRKVKIDNKYIHGKTTKERRRSFSNLIEDFSLLQELFKKLNGSFNGVLFKDVNIILSSKQAISLAKVFKGEEPEEDSLFAGTDSYFEIFDFSIIPVEVISGIYESLIDAETRKLHSAVYTPSFLVEYILNDTVDKYLDKHQVSECKIFDPSVGSGIFLVQSLRKMIDKELELNKHNGIDPDERQFSVRIREIATNNLFGIDINPEALKVSCFSIYIALLDYQEPKDIDSYKFPDLLGENLFEANFFNTKHFFNEKIKGINLNFILGNPPWKKDKSEIHLNWVNSTKTYSKKVNGKLEVAQSFLLHSKDFMQLETVSALIVTSTIFYNISTTTKEFKNEFLTSVCINKFFDLSPVRRLIFEKKNSPATVVYYSLSKEKSYLKNTIKHLSIKSNIFLKHFKVLVIEKFDQKEILQKYFIENGWMFKVALYGNTLDFHLLKRLENITSKKVVDLIDNIKVFGGAGILKGTPKDNFSFLLGLPINKNKGINRFYTQNSSNILTIEDIFLESGRKISQFDGYKILFKEQAEKESDIVVSYNNAPSVFKKGVFGINSKDEKAIKQIYNYLISNIYTYFVFSISGSWGTSTRPQIRFKDEFLSFPFIEPNEKTRSKLIYLANKFIQPFKEHYKQFNLGEPHKEEKVFSEINETINNLYGVKEHEKDLIDYVLDVSRYQFQESKQDMFIRHVHADTQFLEKYATVYINEFEKIYQDEYLQVEIYPLGYFIAMNFVLLKEKPRKTKRIVFPKDKLNEKEVLKRLANNLSISQITNTNDPSKNLFIQKDIKGFEKDSFYIIKPNEYKSWHRAMAWYDIAEFMEVIEQDELEYLKGNPNAW